MLARIDASFGSGLRCRLRSWRIVVPKIPCVLFAAAQLLEAVKRELALRRWCRRTDPGWPLWRCRQTIVGVAGENARIERHSSAS
jgi:hypothetical protein